jgi:hypothetical protein
MVAPRGGRFESDAIFPGPDALLHHPRRAAGDDATIGEVARDDRARGDNATVPDPDPGKDHRAEADLTALADPCVVG